MHKMNEKTEKEMKGQRLTTSASSRLALRPAGGEIDDLHRQRNVGD
jgi:hypothetical protein